MKHISNNTISQITADSVLNEVHKDLRVVDIISETVEENVTRSVDEETIAPDAPPEKVKRYIARGVEDVKQIINDISYELDNTISGGSVKVTTLSLPEDGQAIIEIKQMLNVKDLDLAEKIPAQAAKFSLRPEFVRYINYQLKTSPTKGSSVNIKVTIPKAVVDDLAGEDADWKKRGSSVEKFARSLTKKL